jgi:hypothetical protein
MPETSRPRHHLPVPSAQISPSRVGAFRCQERPPVGTAAGTPAGPRVAVRKGRRDVEDQEGHGGR